MNPEKRVSFDTENYWELGGESTLHCETIPDPPNPRDDTLVRITHSNVYGPVDGIEFFVRIGDPDNPTVFDDQDSTTDWVKTELVEEIVMVDDVEMYRSDATEPFGREEEVPWDGTFEARLRLPSGNSTIEIKVLSSGDLLQSGVIADWIQQIG